MCILRKTVVLRNCKTGSIFDLTTTPVVIKEIFFMQEVVMHFITIIIINCFAVTVERCDQVPELVYFLQYGKPCPRQKEVLRKKILFVRNVMCVRVCEKGEG